MKRPATTSNIAAPQQPITVERLNELSKMLEGFAPAPLAFEISVSSVMPKGFGSFSRMESGEMKVVWTGRLSEAPDWPLGAKLWVHADDYDRFRAASKP